MYTILIRKDTSVLVYILFTPFTNFSFSHTDAILLGSIMEKIYETLQNNVDNELELEKNFIEGLVNNTNLPWLI